MSCQLCREHLSADLDGEAGPGGSTPDDAYRHLESCAGCTRWFADATRINRLVRTATAEPGPGFTDAQLDGLLDLLPPPATARRPWGRQLARVALALVGLVQVTLGAWSLWVPHGGHMEGHAAMMAGAGMVHMSHEYSAWSIALGIAFLVGAAWTRHLAGALPVLASFVAVLVTVSVVDLINDSVDADRVFSHGLVVLALGLIVVIVLTQPEDLRPSQGPGRVRADLEDEFAGIALPAQDDRTSHRGSSEPAARHRAA